MSAASASGPGLYNVVLVGEVHADDLGTTLSDACSKFYATSSQNRSRFPKIAFFMRMFLNKKFNYKFVLEKKR